MGETAMLPRHPFTLRRVWIVFAAALAGVALLRAEDDVYATLTVQMKKDLGPKFTIKKVNGIFIAATNDSDKAFERYIDTISTATDGVYKEFFTKKPEKPVGVYLFKDKDSYNAFNVSHFGHEPDTPYGFYTPSERKLVMNISTGTGTLVHEMMHPILEADFPGIPSWFNEGFASLFEQCRYDEKGRLRGMINWRFPILKKAIDEKKWTPLEDLMKTSTDAFYGEERGLNYAEARYLCYYLQEHGQLEAFYKAYRDGMAKDPTVDGAGIKSLEKVTGKPLAELEKAWITWSKGLKTDPR